MSNSAIGFVTFLCTSYSNSRHIIFFFFFFFFPVFFFFFFFFFFSCFFFPVFFFFFYLKSNSYGIPPDASLLIFTQKKDPLPCISWAFLYQVLTFLLSSLCVGHLSVESMLFLTYHIHYIIIS